MFHSGLTNSSSKGAKATEVLLLSRGEIEKLLTMGDVLRAVQKAFKLQAEGKAIMPPKLYLDLPEYEGDFRAMPAYSNGSAGVKWVSVYPNNWRHGLPCVMAIIALCDPKTGCLLGVMDGTYITSMRTGAAGGIAVQYLARRDSSVIGIIGAGTQARTQLQAISQVLLRIEEVKVFDLRRDASQGFCAEMGAKLHIDVRPVETVEEATQADVLVTATPSRVPFVKKRHIRPGTHINAIGADAPGKQELETDVLKNAKIVVDDIEQASHSGEINVPLSEGLIRVEEIYGTLGEVVAGIKKGRENDQEITLFDSTGLAILDIICAKLVYERAKEIGHPKHTTR
jgi:alanine dehydrogenase